MNRTYALKLKFLSAAIATAMAPGLVSANDNWALEEVVVTAQKRAQNLNDVGISVNAFTGENMKDLGISNATDMAQHTPGLVYSETSPSNVPVYSIRGMGFDDYSANTTSTVGVYVNEVAKPYPVLTTGSLYDIERVEVLKGVQGTLYGRNSTAGAINFITNKPSDEFSGSVGLEYGRYDKTKVEGHINGALSDAMQGRFAFTTTQGGEGIQKHVTTGEELGDNDKQAFRGMLNIDASDNVSILLSASYSKDDSDGWATLGNTQYQAAMPGASTAPGLVGVDLGVFDPNELSSLDRKDPRAAAWSEGFKPNIDQETQEYSATVTWDISDSYTLTSITSYDTFNRDNVSDWDGTSTENNQFTNKTDIESYTQELRINAEMGELTWVAGIYVSEDEVDETYFAACGESTGCGSLFFGQVENRYFQETETSSAFAQADYQFNEQWKLTLGLRYTREEQDFEACTHDVDGGLSFLYSFSLDILGTPLELPQGACITLNTSTFEIPIQPFSSDIKTDNWSGKIGLDYTPNNDWMIYGTIASGFKSGGHNGAFANVTDILQPYKEEEVISYELGFKATLLDSTMQLNGALFYSDYRDKQLLDSVPTIFGPLTTTVNVPESEIKGAELELQWRPLQGLDLKAGVSYLDTEVEDYIGFPVLNPGNTAGGILTDHGALGTELTNAPQWQYNALAAYEFGIADGLLLRTVVDASYTDDFKVNLEENDAHLMDGYTLVNARIALVSESGDWEVAAWGRNLFDKFYTLANSFGNDNFGSATGPGRTYGISASYNF